jgi:hypothetical protein
MADTADFLSLRASAGESEAPQPQGQPPRLGEPAPEPRLIRGTCPVCGEALISAPVYVQDRGYLLIWKCVGSACGYRRVL